MRTSKPLRRGFTLVELLVAIAIIGVLTALLLPAVQQAREAARKTECRNNLRQIGVALHNYHSQFNAFPPGAIGLQNDPVNIQGWGWATLLLPHLEQQSVYDALNPNQNSLPMILIDPVRQPLLRTPMSVFRCPSDNGDVLQSENRTLSGFDLSSMAMSNPQPSGPMFAFTIPSLKVGSAGGPLLACLLPPIGGVAGGSSSGSGDDIGGGSGGGGSGGDGSGGGAGGSGGDGSGGGSGGSGGSGGGGTGGSGGSGGSASDLPKVYGYRAATSNYVASFGDLWIPSGSWTNKDYAGNGLFGSNVSVSIRDIRDGASQTFAVGERCWTSYASIWAGTDGWNRCEREGIAMVLATGHYPLNSSPNPYYLSCDPGGAAGFTSTHASGANFLMADGSVRFISNHIQFANSTEPSRLGVYQKLSRRDDGQAVGDY